MIATGRPSPTVTPPRMARSVSADISPNPNAPRWPRESSPAPPASPLSGRRGVPGPRRELVQHDLLGGPTAEEDRDPVDEVLLRVVVLVVERQLLGEPEGPPARNDGDLVHGIGAGQEVGDQGVARLVIRDRPLL